jgi:ribosomal protein L16/L10AE
MFEMEGVTEAEARKAMQLASAKLPMKTKFATRFSQEKAS